MKFRLLVSHEHILVILFPVIIVSLLLTILTGTAALVWNGQPIGDGATTVADVFAWIFAAAFLTAFLIAVIEEHK